MDKIKSLTFHVVPNLFAICNIIGGEKAPDWYYKSTFRSATRNGNNLSLICDQEFVPLEVEGLRDYRGLVIAEPIAHNVHGILAEVTEILAEARIPVFVISTYDTDYIFFHEGHLKVAIHELEIKGHAVVTDSDK